MDYQLVAVLIAGLAALLSYFSAREARKSSSSAAKVAEDIANKQHRTQLNDLKLQYHSEVREWAAETIKVMNELIVLCYIGEEPVNGHFKERQLELTYRISALLDIGRWFSPTLTIPRWDKIIPLHFRVNAVKCWIVCLTALNWATRSVP